MTLLLDTHAFLWWLGGEPLDPATADRIADPGTVVAVSAVSIWEAAIKRAAGKLVAPDDLAGRIRPEGFEPLPITPDHAERAGGLPLHHRDPFDRMLVAQAEIEGLVLVTRDPSFEPYGITTLTC